MDNNKLNEVLTDARAGKLPQYSIEDLRSFSAGCICYIENRVPNIAQLKAAIDDEIRRKETAELEQRTASRDREKIETIGKINEKISTIDSRLGSVEREAMRPAFKTWTFWIAVGSGLIASFALCRDYFGWSFPSPASSSATQPVSPTPSPDSQMPGSLPLPPEPKSAPGQTTATNLSDSSTSQPPRLTPKP